VSGVVDNPGSNNAFCRKYLNVSLAPTKLQSHKVVAMVSVMEISSGSIPNQANFFNLSSSNNPFKLRLKEATRL